MTQISTVWKLIAFLSAFLLFCPGGYPNLTWLGGTPRWGTPCPDLALEHPNLTWLGVSHLVNPQEGSWDQSLEFPLERTWDRWKYYGKQMGYPPPHGFEMTNKLKQLPSPILLIPSDSII